MTFPYEEISDIHETPEVFLNKIGRVFAVFDEQTQDSGNISYGVQIGDTRYFVKTAGKPENTDCALGHERRAALLGNAARLWRECPDPAFPKLERVLGASPHGPLFIWEWMEGDSLGTTRAQRDDPRSAFQRFRGLAPDEIAAALNTVFAVHSALGRAGWIAVDFYDASLIYDFQHRRMRLLDFDMYHKGPFTNDMGRMFGSSRFMSPEEFIHGVRIDERSTVYTMGRAAAVFLADGSLERAAWRGSSGAHAVIVRACAARPEDRFPTVASFHAAWNSSSH